VKPFFITAKTDTPLQQLLSAHLPSQYNPEVVITSGGVWKDKKRIFDPGFIIRSQETVKVHTSTFQGKFYTLGRGEVVFENEDLLVVYKPCNLNVHAIPTSIHYHLTYGVNSYLQTRGIEYKATPLTRLDRPVEGLVLFAKNKPAERRLFKLVKQRRIKKWYTAALEKRERKKAPKWMRIRDRVSTDSARTLWDNSGKEADSLFIKAESLESADIYSVFIFTGRKHQIRFHASHYIAPIIGDTFYGSTTILPPDEIALLCRGYNIPWKPQMLRIRLPQRYLDRFFEKIKT
jgi:23S rRNA-/tRNA-specific pseudouridylate synthase